MTVCDFLGDEHDGLCISLNRSLVKKVVGYDMLIVEVRIHCNRRIMGCKLCRNKYNLKVK